jgi:phospholipid/cholesterol/gamma-HCH transport system permease protein
MDRALRRIRFYVDLLAGSVTRLHVIGNPMVRLVFLRQIHFTAVRSIPLLAVVALAFGAAFITQATQVLGSDPRLFELVEIAVVRNIGPLLAAIIIIGRSATAISTQLALMRCTGEIDTLRNLRIPAHDYLVVPRIAAVTLATVGCCFFFQVIAVVGGFAASALILHVSLAEQLSLFAEQVSIGALLLEVAKAACFGFVIAAVACGTGLAIAPRMAEVPLAPARAFLRSLLGVIAIGILFLVATLS